MKIIKILEKEYPYAKTALNFRSPLESLVATILSAQCTDKMVNIVTEALFQKYQSARDYANADLNELEEDIRSTGFFRRKAKSIKKSCQILVDKFDSQVPKTMEELLELPGVARKTANIVLSNVHGVVEGIAVDTHVRRISRRLELTESEDPSRIEKDLMHLVPRERWMKITDLLISHGRRVCVSRKPKCEICVLKALCPSAFASDQQA